MISDGFSHVALQATFMSSYVHTVYIYVVLCLFTIMVYATSPDLGSPGKVRTAQAPLRLAPQFLHIHTLPVPSTMESNTGFALFVFALFAETTCHGHSPAGVGQSACVGGHQPGA